MDGTFVEMQMQRKTAVELRSDKGPFSLGEGSV